MTTAAVALATGVIGIVIGAMLNSWVRNRDAIKAEARKVYSRCSVWRT